MYTAQFTIDRIQSTIKEKGYTQKSVLSECGINENTLKRMTDNKGISSFYLAKIADYLNVSVDYLLGRTDNPEIITGNNINIGNNSVNNNSLNINTNSTTNEISELFDSLTLVQRAKVIVMIDEMKKGE